MQGKKSSREKKRKDSRQECVGGERKRRSTESSAEDPKEVEPKVEAIPEPSDIEEGGLDLNVPLKPISAYVTERQEMLDQCFHVLGENRLRKMLPDELKDCSMAEIKTLCWDQLQQLSDCNLLQILEGKELTASSEAQEKDAKRNSVESQQDNNVDSTSSVPAEAEDKQGGSGEESDVLSINADMDDSDIEGHKESRPLEVEAPSNVTTTPSVSAPPPELDVQSEEPKLELQQDIDKSVSEILALTSPPSCQAAAVPTPASLPAAPTAVPSEQQLALLELEMRARAIKALMKANELKK